MKITLRNIDRRAALLAGHEVGPVVTIDASPSDFGDAWPAVLASLDLSNDGSAVCRARAISAPTVDAIIDAVAMDKAHFDAAWAEITAEIEAAIAATLTAEPRPVEQVVHDPATNRPVGRLTTLQTPHIQRPSPFDGRVTAEHRDDPIWARLNVAYNALVDAIQATNKATIEAALPRLRAERAEQDAAALKQAQEDAEAQKKMLAARGAERLASGFWERETVGYNSRREGKPWCAHVTLNAATGKLDYAWGEWTGRPGEAGLMRLACKPGDLIAWGQKDMRRPDKSTHVIQRMREDGLMENLSTVDAVKALRG